MLLALLQAMDDFVLHAVMASMIMQFADKDHLGCAQLGQQLLIADFCAAGGGQQVRMCCSRRG